MLGGDALNIEEFEWRGWAGGRIFFFVFDRVWGLGVVDLDS